MNQLALCGAAALALASASLAVEKPAGQVLKSEVKCAVMTAHKVNVKEATAKKAFADHKGRRYFFCCAGCKPDFVKNPGKYAKADSIATPKPVR